LRSARSRAAFASSAWPVREPDEGESRERTRVVHRIEADGRFEIALGAEVVVLRGADRSARHERGGVGPFARTASSDFNASAGFPWSHATTGASGERVGVVRVGRLRASNASAAAARSFNCNAASPARRRARARSVAPATPDGSLWRATSISARASGRIAAREEELAEGQSRGEARSVERDRFAEVFVGVARELELPFELRARDHRLGVRLQRSFGHRPVELPRSRSG